MMEEKIRSAKENMQNAGYEIIFEESAVVGSNSNITSEEITFLPNVEYSIMLFADDCIECEPQLVFLFDGKEYDTKEKYQREGNITSAWKNFNDDSIYKGKIIGKINSETSRNCYLLIAKNEDFNP